MITEISHDLTDDQRNTLLFLTGGLKVIKSSELSEAECNNLQIFFGYKVSDKKIIKTIIFKDHVVTKVVCK